MGVAADFLLCLLRPFWISVGQDYAVALIGDLFRSSFADARICARYDDCFVLHPKKLNELRGRGNIPTIGTFFFKGWKPCLTNRGRVRIVSIIRIRNLPMVGPLVYRILLLFIAGTVAAGAMEYKRERYDVIVDRSPFGEDPLLAQQAQQNAANGAKDAADAAAAAKKMEKEMRLCYLLEAESGDIRAGFQNLKARPGDPKSIMLKVGESFNGMKLASISIDENSATLSINGKNVTFELAAAKAAPAVKAAAQPARRFGGGFRAKPAAPVKPPEPQLSPEEQVQKREEVRENLRQYQMEVIRQGMPPLPIPLTQDMDDQLVAEGILPPGAP